MPFGDDPSDLPLFEMQQDFDRSLKNLMDINALAVPDFDYQQEIHCFLSSAHINFDDDMQKALELEDLETLKKRGARNTVIKTLSRSLTGIEHARATQLGELGKDGELEGNARTGR